MVESATKLKELNAVGSTQLTKLGKLSQSKQGKKTDKNSNMKRLGRKYSKAKDKAASVKDARNVTHRMGL